jgi:hypothetical protein
MPDLLIDYLRRNSPVKEIVNSKLTVKAWKGILYLWNYRFYEEGMLCIKD